jgi:carboxypeptidase C (cathepsin A)
MVLRSFAPALLLCLTLPAIAQREAPATPPASPAASSPSTPAKPEPHPADKTIAQTVTVNGKTLHYTATVGTIELKSPENKPTGEVVFTAYILDRSHDAPARPVTFALNGGPGASSVYLNLGAIGPKHIPFANQGDSASDPATLTDNPATWLDFTDLVFIDPIGTGFSRSLVDEAETKKLFYAATPDVEYLSLVIYKWLVKNDRMLAKKYLIGESYGGYRGPRIAHYLQSQIGVALNGVVLVSPALRPPAGDSTISPIPWMVTLPAITAAHLENQGKLTPEAMRQVIDYTEGEYATALLKGPADKPLNDAMIAHVTEMTGLDPQFVRNAGGRLDTRAYLREVHRQQGVIGSVYDSNVTSPDPFPYASAEDFNDPILESIIAPTTTAMVDFVTRTVGWKTDARYHALSYDVNRLWSRENNGFRGDAAEDLRHAVAADPKLKILIVHGWNDLSCPFMGSVITANQLPTPLQKQVEIHEFPGGHMFYTRQANGAGLHSLADTMVSTH